MSIRRFVFLALAAVPIVVAQQPAAQSASAFILVPALAVGAVIGLYEAITLMKDVQVPQHKFGHAFAAFAWSLVATFLCFNVDFALSLVPALKTVPVLGSVLGVRVLIGVLTAIKVHAVSRVTKSSAGLSGLSETWFHTFFIGALVVAAPYILMALGSSLPVWLRI